MGPLNKRTLATTTSSVATSSTRHQQEQQQQPSISTSKTMPQLCYTRQDIHEQYLSTNSLRREQVAAAAANKRARSSGGGCGDARASDKSEAMKNNCRQQEDYDSQVHEHERRKRSRSLSLFSGCFSISNISSMLSGSGGSSSSTTRANHHLDASDGDAGTQRVSRRRAFLAQLGLASGQPSKKRRRPISASQTAGNLQQVAKENAQYSDEENNIRSMMTNDSQPALTSSSAIGRKHVSFGGRAQRPSTSVSGTLLDSQKSIPSASQATPSSQQGQRRTTARNPISGGSNNVIIRNYQANISAHLMPSANGCGSGLEDKTNATHPNLVNSSCQSAASPATAKKPPIYLVSMVANNLPTQSTGSTPRKIANNQSYSAMKHQSATAAANKTINQDTPERPSHHQQQSPHQPRTIYKSLPPVPMRTIATQTVITRHHLMELAPSLIPASFPLADVSQMVIDPASEELTCAVRRASAAKPAGDSCAKTRPSTAMKTTKKASNIEQNDQRAPVQAADDDEDRWSAGTDSSDEDGDTDPAESRSARRLATYSCGSSASSSASSLVAHDSALLARAATLLDEKAGKAAAVCRAPSPPISACRAPVATSIIEIGPEVGLVESVGAESRSGDGHSSGASDSDAAAHAADIEPPSEFATSQSAREPAMDTLASEDATLPEALSSLGACNEGDLDVETEGNHTTTEGRHNKSVEDSASGGSGAAAIADDERWAPSPPSLSEASSQTTTDGALAARIIDLGHKLSSESGSTVLVAGLNRGGSCRPSVSTAAKRSPISGGRRPKWASSDSAAAVNEANPGVAAMVANAQMAPIDTSTAEQVQRYDEMVKAARSIDGKSSNMAPSGVDRLLQAAVAGRQDEFMMSKDDDDRRRQSRASSSSLGPLSSTSSTRRSAEKRRDDFLMFATETTTTESCDFEPPSPSNIGRRESTALANRTVTNVDEEACGANNGQSKFEGSPRPDWPSKLPSDATMDVVYDEHPDAHSIADSRASRSSSRPDISPLDAAAANYGKTPRDNQADGSAEAGDDRQYPSLSTTGWDSERAEQKQPADEEAGGGEVSESPLEQVAKASSFGEAANGADERLEGGEGTTTATIIKRDYNGGDHKISTLADDNDQEQEVPDLNLEDPHLAQAEGPPLTTEDTKRDSSPPKSQGSSATVSGAEELAAGACAASSLTLLGQADVEASFSDETNQLAGQGRLQLPQTAQDLELEDQPSASMEPSVASYVPMPEAAATDAESESCSPVLLASQQEQDVFAASTTAGEDFSSQAMATSVASVVINSPPTTVTELEQDDEAPSSLVEIYRDRLGQIHRFADSVLGRLMEECFAAVSNGDHLARDLLAEVCLVDRDLAVSSRHSLSTSMSSETVTTTASDTSSTSASGHSRPCCHSKKIPHAAANRRPAVPEKPAHLTGSVEAPGCAFMVGKLVRGQPEAAAALAVTATSIAAASLLHNTYNPPKSLNARAQTSQVIESSDAETNGDNTAGIHCGLGGFGEKEAQDLKEDALLSTYSSCAETTEQVRQSPPLLTEQHGSHESSYTKVSAGESSAEQAKSNVATSVAATSDTNFAASGSETDSASTSGLSHLATLGSSQKSAVISSPSNQQALRENAAQLNLETASEEFVDEENDVELEMPETFVAGSIGRRASHVELSTLSELSEEMSANGGQVTISSNAESVAAPGAHHHKTVAQQANNRQSPPERQTIERQISTQSAQSSIPDSQNELVAQLTNETSSPQPISSTASNDMFDVAGGSGTITQVEPNNAEQPWSRSSSIQLRQPPIRSGRSSATSPLPSNEAYLGDPPTQGALTHILRTGMDCPYVSDIFPPSPPPPPPPLPVEGSSSGEASASSKVTPLACVHHRSRLSHDDTLEAIEDDVEGEEQEMMQQVAGGPDRHQLYNAFNIAPPPEFALSMENDTETCPTPPASSKSLSKEPAVDRLEEEEDEGDDEEESSISVSQRHGIVVSQQQDQQRRESRNSLTPTQTPPPEPTADSAKPTDALETPEPEHRPHVASIQPFKASQSASGDSITHAMLEHMSRNKTQRLELEEPAPDLEQSRSLQRQQSTTSDSDAGLAGDHQSSTGTIKRRRADLKKPLNESPEAESRVAEVIKPQAEKVGSRGRGPPLGQTKLASSQQSRQRQQSESQQGRQSPVDSSICSTCSCLMASEELSDGQLAELAATGEQLHTNSTTATRRQVSRGWMSHDDGSVFTENYWLTHWLYISEHDECKIWSRAIDIVGSSRHCELARTEEIPDNVSETGSTKSERNFSCKYRSTTRKMIHRRATIEMYNRVMKNSLKSEKRIQISRSDGEFGFRIHGSRPVVVSAIERGTSAETCGLQVGDMLYAINGTKIIDMSHSDVVKLAHRADPSSLVLDLVPSNDFLKMNKYNKSDNKLYQPMMTGYLLRLSPSTVQPLLNDLQEKMSRLTDVSQQQRTNKMNEVIRLAWRRRYFVLRNDNCLFWYKSESDIEPCGGINLQGFCASLAKEFDEPTYVLRLFKQGRLPYFLGTNNVCDIQTWIDSLNKAATDANQNDLYMEKSMTLARCPPSDIPDPDCTGYLHKYSHKKNGGSHWAPGYFVLKDTCLYMFRTQQTEPADRASAIYYLQGYRVKSRRNEKDESCCPEPSRSKRHTFELIPHNKRPIKTLSLMASSETDMKRWIAALEYSIDRWIEIE